MKRFVVASVVVSGLLFATSSSRAEEVKLSAEETKFFESKVRPILVSNCYKCHSAEERKNKGGLTLDTRDGWSKGGKHGPAVVPGDPSKSLLMKAVKFEDPDLQMPPNGDKLKDEQIEVLEKWVKMGAPDPRRATADHEAKLTGLTDAARAHWAYQPVKSPAVPEVKETAWVKSPVDAFVLAKLEAEKMKPSTPAPREALIRRATFDLIGLPPTPEEVDAFVRDRSPDAFAKVIDRLLASPRYGERWGRYWLDTARYSDTTGLDNNNKSEYRFPYAWTYRDYVINAFNEDKPYDTFLKEQIAADLIPGAKDDPARLAGLGFITVGKRFQNPHDTIDERIDAVTKTTMAMTVACARCHDHKFDPIPTADYYSLHGVFASTTEPMEKPIVGARPTGDAYDQFCTELAKAEADVRDRYYNLFEEKLEKFFKRPGEYLFVAAINRRADPARIKLRNEVLAKGNFDRDIYGASLRKHLRPNDPVFGPLAVFSQLPDGRFAEQADDVLPRMEKVFRKRGGVNPLVAKAFEAVPAGSLKSLRDVAAVYDKLYKDTDAAARAEQYIAACRKAKTAADIKGYDADFLELIGLMGEIEPAGTLTHDHLREIAPELPVVNQGGYKVLQLARVSELLLTHPGSPARAMVVADKDKGDIKNSPIFIRGEQSNRGDVVPRQFLEIVSPKDRKPFQNGSGRLELAEAIASKDNPLTARVMVNRMWMHHFGQGFVRTPDDLGVQSEAPSHPELLDYLATRFVNDGWSIKSMHRLIMLSSTYQQNSETNNVYAQKDPDNRLLWRGNLRRLDFEAVRDSMLMFTGKLDLTVGGKPVNLTDEPYSNRRSVYGYIDRGNLPELMAQFDFADPDMTNSKRTNTIVPQQALFFMNSPMAVDVARKVTSRPEFVNAPTDAKRVAALYEVLFQRPPRAAEVRFASEFLQSAGAYSEANSGSAADERPMSKKEAREARRREEMNTQRAKREMERQKQKNRGRAAIRNEGELVERKPLTPWEQYAQALLFTNEIVYVN